MSGETERQRCTGTKDRPACFNQALEGYRRCYFCEKGELLAGFQFWIIWGPLLGVLAVALTFAALSALDR